MTVTTHRRTLELRIHERDTVTPSAGTVEFTLAHSRFRTIPSFGGQTVRYTEGRTESRPYWIDVVDQDGELTAVMAANGRMALLGRLAELRLDTDGAGFTTIEYRRISNVESGSARAFRLELSDERWIERRTLLFERTTSWQLHPRGPSVAWMNRPPAGTAAYGVDVVSSDYVSLYPIAGIDRLSPLLVEVLHGDLADAPSITGGSFVALRFESAGPTDRPVLRFDPDLERVAQDGVASQLLNPLGPFVQSTHEDGPFWNAVLVYWPGHGLSSGATVSGRLHWAGTGIPTTADTPYLVGGAAGIRAPDFYAEIAAGDHGGPVQQVDPAAFAALAGETFPPAWYRLEAPAPRDGFVEREFCQLYTLIPFVDGIGRLAPRSLRPPQDVDPDTLSVFNASNVPSEVVWRNPGSDAITAVDFRGRARLPHFGIVLRYVRRREWDTLPLLGLRQVTIEPQAIFRLQDIAGVAAGVTEDLFERFGDGPQVWEWRALIADGAPEAGDLVVLDLDQLHVPNAATAARSGKRVLHVIERMRVYAEDGGYYAYRGLDAGPNSQPLATPTVSVSQTTGDEKHGVDVQVSNVPAGATAIVQVAHGAAPAAADWVTAATGVGNETIAIGRRPSGTQINVRAIATAPNRIRSAASAVDDVTTASLTAPTVVTATASGRSVKVEATLGETLYEVEYLIDGVSRLVLPAGSSQHTFHALAVSTSFEFGVRHRDPYGGVSSTTTDTEATGTALDAPDLAGFSARPVVIPPEKREFIFPNEDPLDAPEVSGVVAQLRTLAGDPAFGIVIERAPDDTGSPDEANRLRLVTLPGTARGHRDPRPQGGAQLWYRAFHARAGWNDGTPTSWVAVNFDDVDTGDPNPPAVGDDDVLRLKRGTVYDDGKYAPRGEADGHLTEDVLKYDGTELYALARHVEEPVFARDGDSVTFGRPYQHAPTLAIGALKVRTWDPGWTTTERILRVYAANVSVSGYDVVAKNVAPGTITARDDDFPAGNLLDALGETTELTLGDAPANDDTYQIHYRVDLSAHALEFGPRTTITIVVAIDTDAPGDGPWIERKTKQYSVSQDGWSGLDPGEELATWAHEIQTVTVTGLTSSSQVRIRIKAVTVTGTGATAHETHGFNQPTDGDADHGATYTTATDASESATPNTEDGVQLVPVETS